MTLAWWLSGRMPRSREHGFEYVFATISKFGYFRSLHEYLAIHGGGIVSDYERIVFTCNCCLARMLPREVDLVSE